MSLLSLNDLGKDADANKIDLTLAFSVGHIGFLRAALKFWGQVYNVSIRS